jgi:hypothetical protein
MTMTTPGNNDKLAREFAEAVLRENWSGLSKLFAKSALSPSEAQSLAREFGWDQLGPRLRRMYAEMTGEPEDMIPHLDPPKRCVVFPAVNREPPAGLPPSVRVHFMGVHFLPGEDSGFDTCYDCFLSLIDENGPRVLAYDIELAS